MGFWTLFEAASMPVLQVLIISILGALMATHSWNLLHVSARTSLNKIVFQILTPSLMFANLAKTVTLPEIISWWFMPVNIALTFLIGGILGWILVKLLKPKPHLEGLIIATTSAGNLGNLLLIIVPAVCEEDGSPFGDPTTCRSIGLSYASFSMALGGFFVWTFAYQQIRTSAAKLRALEAAADKEEEEEEEASKAPNSDLEATHQTNLLQGLNIAAVQDTESQASVSQVESGHEHDGVWNKVVGFVHQILEELLAPPTLAAIVGLIFGAVTFLKNLIIGDHAPLRVIQDSIELLGDGTIPCITLILGGNLTQGLKSSKIKPSIIFGVVCIRYIIAPAIGMWVVMAAANLGFLSSDPLYKYVLMVQYALPPAMNIGTMTQLYDVGQEECSVLFLWTYLASAIALTVWSTVFMWILSSS